ncbi:hypothetical protein [Streptomyces sp. IMTB 2501]|uniref:hypothetical protein n=1 Tax=Streptomyces sp. IMTB 2501 TaxID=1776340 RepID=UPI0021160EFE|nr:hypothetical protein [Streptomyces sp. IMTB 2501]
MKVLAGAAFAIAATTAVAVPASATDFATRSGDTSLMGEVGGILNNHGAPLGNIDGRCLVPLPEGEGIGGHGLGSLMNECNIAPVDQYQAPQKLL